MTNNSLMIELADVFTSKGVVGYPSDETPFTKEMAHQSKKDRGNEERRLLKLMIRENARLSEKQRLGLERWENFFNMETHNALLTQALEILDRPVSVAPNPSEDSCSMFINRFCEIQWMLHRTLPFLQSNTKMFGQEWIEK
jgi:hypothetical protein